MMKVTAGHSLDEASCAALASGRAEPALGLFIDSLLELRGLSPGEGEAIAGASLESETPAEMSPDALDMAFAAIERGGPAKRPAAPAYPELAALPAALVDAITEAEAGAGWKGVTSGLRQLKLNLDGEARAQILRIEAGVAIPWHTHKGQELTLCLRGEFSDSRGVYGPGDFSIADPTMRHKPRAHDAGPVYALAVTDAGLKFEGLLGALQKLIGR